MDFIKAVSIIKKDLEEARALLDQLSATPGTYIAEIELARSRIRSATELLVHFERRSNSIHIGQIAIRSFQATHFIAP